MVSRWRRCTYITHITYTDRYPPPLPSPSPPHPYLYTSIHPHAHLRLRTPHARPPSPPAPTLGQALLHFLDRPLELPRSYIDEACPVFDCCCAPGAPHNVSEETRAALRTAAAAATGSMPPRNAGTVDAPRLTEAPRLVVDGLEDSRYRTVVEARLGGLQTEMTPTAAVAAAAALLVGIAAVARRRRRAVAATDALLL